MKKKISIIASFRNESGNIVKFVDEIEKSFKKNKNYSYEIIFIDDASTDKSNKIIKTLKTKNKKIKLIELKKNCGHSPSIQLGLKYVDKNNYLTIIDCDLQDPPNLIFKGLKKANLNTTIHFVRKKRNDGNFQKIYSSIAYFILKIISINKIVGNANYFKIIPPIAVKKLKKNKEQLPYWNYLITMVSKKTKKIFYLRRKRNHGNSKYSIFSLNPWLTFYGGIYYFPKNYFILLSIVTFFINFLIKNFINNSFLIFFNLLLLSNLLFFLWTCYYKKKLKIKYYYKFFK